MARFARYTQSVFGATAGTAQLSKFGSLAAGTPQTYAGTTITPALVQALSNYASGWFSAIVGANSPAIEDMNAVCYLFAYQLSYLLQLGIPEWDSGTTYYTGSICQDGSGNLFVSITNNNLNNALTSGTNWRPAGGSKTLVAINPATASPYTLTTADVGKCFLVNSANGAMTFNLPNPATVSLGFSFTVKDQSGNFGTNNCTFHRFAAENFENLAADYVTAAAFGEYEISTDQVNWYITGR